MNPNPPQDENPIEKLNHSLPDEALPSRDPLLNQWAAQQPQANPDFQQRLEDLVIAQLNAQHHPHIKEPIMTTLAQPKTNRRNFNFFWPTSLVATFSVILLGLFITLFNQNPFGHGNLAVPLMTATTEQDTHPTPVPLMTATLTPTPYIYTIRDGDTLFSIARLQNVDLQALLANNNLMVDTPLTVGQTLTMPPILPNPAPLFAQPQTVTQLEAGLLTLRDLPRGTQISEDDIITVYLSAEHVQHLILASDQVDIFNPDTQTIIGLYASRDIPARSLILTEDLSTDRGTNLENAYPLQLPATQIEGLTINDLVRIDANLLFVDVDENYQAITQTDEDLTPENITATIVESASILDIITEEDNQVTVYLSLSTKDLNTLAWIVEANISITLHRLEAE